jgi:hypothetical protein
MKTASRRMVLVILAGTLALGTQAAAAAHGAYPPARGPLRAVLSSLATQSRAEALLSRSMEFHDPEGRWGRDTIRLVWKGTGPEGEERNAFDISMSPDGATFEMSGRYRGSTIKYATAGESLTVAVDGSAEIDDPTRESLRLTRDGGMFWRDYFTYLAGLPMKLRDPGAILDPEPASTEFLGRPVDSIRVTYDPEVGGDTWYFYFDPDTAELVGCRFYHDEAANDGEYIVFDGLIEAGGLRIPQQRRWYVNADDRFLGEDVIESLVIGG